MKASHRFMTYLSQFCKVKAQPLFLIGMLAIAWGFISAPAVAQAAPLTFTVNFSGDTPDKTSGDGVCADAQAVPKCSLRAAIMEANANPGADTIILPAETYTLQLAGKDENAAATGDLDILESVTIIGSNGNPDGLASATVIDAAGIDRVFEINPDPWVKIINATFKAVTIKGGNNTGTGDHAQGGGIYYEATDNVSTTNAGQLYIYNCVIANNTTTDVNGYGAGLELSNYMGAGSALTTIEKSVITGNSATISRGGGIHSSSMPLVIKDSTVSNNHANAGDYYSTGGGLYVNANPVGSTTIQRSTFSGNYADSYGGGGIYTGRPLTVENSTISGNVAATEGGGILGLAANVTLTNTTVTNNQATSTGGGGVARSGAGVLTLRNTIVSGNTGAASNEISGIADANSFNNLVGSNGSGGLTNGTNGNLVGANPQLGPLADNGGLTQTHKLLAGSAAIDAGNSTYVAGTVDQRGRTRSVDAVGETTEDTIAQADIGAYELYPTIGSIGNQSGAAGTKLSAPVTVAGTTTSVTASSSNPSVVPNDAGHLSVVNPTSTTPTLQVTGAGPGTSTITVTVTSDGENTTSTFTMTVTGSPDLTISGNHAPAHFIQGQQGTYSMTVRNIGNAATSGTITVTDTLPAGMTAKSFSGSAGWSCTLSGPVTCTRTTVLPPGLDVQLDLTVDVANNVDTTAGHNNNAVVSGGGADSNPGNNQLDDATLIDPGADLKITKSHTGDFTAGQNGNYTIKVQNAGGSPANGAVTVTDTVPTGLTMVGMSGTGWNCTAGNSCTRSDAVAANGYYPDITVTVTAAASAGNTVTNTASVSGGSDLNVGNNSASDTANIIHYPDLTVTSTHTGNFRQGGTGTYTITVHNSGGADTSGAVTLTDTLPVGITATGMTGGAGWSCTLGTLSCEYTGAAVALGTDFPAVTLTVAVAANAGSPLTNSVSVTGGGETDNTNNTAGDPTTVDQAADLTLTKTDGGATFTQGQADATYTLTVTNSGAGPTVGTVTVTEQPQTGLTVTGMTGTNWTCTVGTLTCTYTGAPVAAAQPFPAITVTVNVASTAPRSVSNTAAVDGGGEMDTTNNSATDSTTVKQLPDLQVSIVPTGTFTQGQSGAQYTIVVTNQGTGLTTGNVNVDVTQLSSKLTPSNINGGANWSCDKATLSCTATAELASGASYPTITLTVRVAADAPASVNTTVTVAGGQDTDTMNNSSTDSTTIIEKPDLTVSKTHTGSFQEGGAGSYTIVVRNDGAAPTSGTVTIVDTLPGGLTAIDMSGTDWNCSKDAGTCTYTGGPVQAKTDFPAIILAVQVANTSASNVDNTVTVSGGGEIKTDNNTAIDPTAITQMPDLTITNSHSGNFRQGQTGAVYTLTVKNAGHAPTIAPVTVSDTLPSGLIVSAIAGDGWSCVLGTLTCTRTDALPARSSYPAITVTVDVATNAPANVVNTVQVTGGGEINTGNNAAADATTIFATGLHFDKLSYTLLQQTSVQTVVSVTYSDSSVDVTPFVTYTSSDKGVVSVNSGLLTGIKSGTSVITAVYEKWTITANVVVTPVLSSLSFDQTSYSITAGQSASVSVNAKYADGSSKKIPEGVIYSIADPETASVSVQGLVTGISAGKATVVTATYGGLTASTTIHVIPASSDQGGNNGSSGGSPGGAPTPPTPPSDEFHIEITGSGGNKQVSITAEQIKSGRISLKTDSDAGKVTIPASIIPDLLARNPALVINFETALGSLTLPLAGLDLAELGRKAGLSAKEMRLEIAIYSVDDTQKAAIEHRNSPGSTWLLSPVEFEVRLTDGERTFRITPFSRYIERTMDLGKVNITPTATGVWWDPAANEFRFVPTTFEQRDGRWKAVMKRPGASIYTVIDKPVTFADLQGHWAKADVEIMASKLIVQGRGADSFDPDATITRAEFAALLTRALGLNNAAEKASFSDVGGGWYESAVDTAFKAGLITGYEDGTFRPDQKISRQELSIMLMRAIRFTGTAPQKLTGQQPDFIDRKSVSDWAVQDVAAAAEAGMIQGDAQGRFLPQNSATRAEASAMLFRMLTSIRFI